MSAQLAIVKNDSALVDMDAFQEYLKTHLTSDLVLQVLEECLLQENSTYNPIDFEQALKELQQKDSGRYQMLKLLLEGYATKEGQVMLDPKMVNASYRQRMKELEFLKSLGRFRRFAYRVFQAMEGLFTEKGETEAIKEAIQITGEVQIARDELAVLELKMSQAERDADRILTEASSANRKIIESANQRATEQTELIYKEARDAAVAERTELTKQLNLWHKAIDKLRQEYGEINEQIANARKGLPTDEYKGYQGYQGYKGFEGVSGYSGFSGYTGLNSSSVGTSAYASSYISSAQKNLSSEALGVSATNQLNSAALSRILLK